MRKLKVINLSTGITYYSAEDRDIAKISILRKTNDPTAWGIIEDGRTYQLSWTNNHWRWTLVIDTKPHNKIVVIWLTQWKNGATIISSLRTDKSREYSNPTSSSRKRFGIALSRHNSRASVCEKLIQINIYNQPLYDYDF